MAKAPQRTGLKIRMAISCVTRLTMLTEDWPFDNVYPPMSEHSPEFDQDFIIHVLEEAHDVWKAILDIRSIREEPSDGADEATDVDAHPPRDSPLQRR